MVSGENRARAVSFPAPTGFSVVGRSNRSHVPAGPCIPRSVPGQPAHLQVKRARYRCKSSSPAPSVHSGPSRCCLHLRVPPQGFSSIHLSPSCGSSYIRFMSSLTAKTASLPCLLIRLFSFFPLTQPCLPRWLCFPTEV